MVVALDAFGPVTDNTGGLAEMAGLPRRRSASTTTRSTISNRRTDGGKRIGSAGLGALVLFYAIEHNGTRLGIDFGAIEAVVLSHGHWDHGGGLLKAFELMQRGIARTEIPIYLHPGMFAERGQRQPDGGVLPAALLPTPDELAEAGAAPEVTARRSSCSTACST